MLTFPSGHDLWQKILQYHTYIEILLRYEIIALLILSRTISFKPGRLHPGHPRPIAWLRLSARMPTKLVSSSRNDVGVTSGPLLWMVRNSNGFNGIDINGIL